MHNSPLSWIEISMGILVRCGDSDGSSILGIFWKFARIGERLSPYVSICCIVMAVRTLVFQTAPDDRYPCLPDKVDIPLRNQIRGVTSKCANCKMGYLVDSQFLGFRTGAIILTRIAESLRASFL